MKRRKDESEREESLTHSGEGWLEDVLNKATSSGQEERGKKEHMKDT